MRFLDLSAAALIAFSSVVALASWNPYQLRQQAWLYNEQASLRGYLVGVASSLGFPWLQRATPDQICAAVLTYSNATLQVSAEGRGFLCSTHPGADTPIVRVTIAFPDRSLSILAWQLAGP